MQSHKLHIISEFAKDRHPYLELPFIEKYDPTEVLNRYNLIHIERCFMLFLIGLSQSC